MKKRIWAFLLAMCMIVSIMPTAAFAGEEATLTPAPLTPAPKYYKFDGTRINDAAGADITLSKTAVDNGDGTYTITLTASAEDIVYPKPTKVIFVLDSSSSMSTCAVPGHAHGIYDSDCSTTQTNNNFSTGFSSDLSRWKIATKAINTMKGNLGTSGIEYTHVMFGTGASLDNTNQFSKPLSGVNYTHLSSGIELGVKQVMTGGKFKDPSSNHVMIIVADGASNDGYDPDGYLDDFKDEGGEVYVVGFTFANADFRKLASDTSYFKDAENETALNVAMKQITENIAGLINDPMGSAFDLVTNSVEVSTEGVLTTSDNTINWTDKDGLQTVTMTYDVAINLDNIEAGTKTYALNGNAQLNYSIGNEKHSVSFPVPSAEISAATLDVIYKFEDRVVNTEHEGLVLPAEEFKTSIPAVGDSYRDYWVIGVSAAAPTNPTAQAYEIVVALSKTRPVTEYGVTYAYVSGTNGKNLPSAISTDSGTFAVSDTNKYPAGAEVALRETAPGVGTTYNVVEDGVTVGTWTLNKWEPDSSAVMTENGIQFIGTWTYTDADKYDVTYYIDGAVDGTPESYYAGERVVVKDAPQKAGFIFSGWDKTDSFLMPAEDVEINGSWIKLVTLIFDANGGAWEEAVEGFNMNEEMTTATKVAEGSYTLTPVTQPTREGYTFTGWYNEDIQPGAIGLYGQPLKIDLTLYAGWEEVKPEDVKYTVRQHYIGAEGTEVAAVNLIDLTAAAGTTADEIIANYAQNQTYYGQNYLYIAEETTVNGADEGNALINGTVIDLYYYLDIWNDEEDKIDEGDEIPDMYQAVVKFQAGDVNGTVTGDGIIQVFTQINDSPARSAEFEITPNLSEVIVTANESYAFDIWTKDEGETGVNPETTITVAGGSITNFYAHFEIDTLNKEDPYIPGGDGIPDKYQALVTYKVVNGTWSDDSATDIVKVFTLKTKEATAEEWIDIEGVALGEMPTGMKPAADYIDKGEWDKTHAATDKPVHGSVYTYTFTTTKAPSISITKAVDGATTVKVGDTAKYTITVTNTGNVVLNNAKVVDELTGDEWTIEVLGVGESKTFNASYKTTSKDAGKKIKNIAVVEVPEGPNDEAVNEDVTVKPNAPITPVGPNPKPQLSKADHLSYIIGYDDGTVRPLANITRAEVATIFFRLLTEESRAQFWSQENPFPDVTEDMWCNNAISTMFNAGIITGYPDGTFQPYAPVTRAEFATIAARFSNEVSDGVSDFFDVPEGYWAYEYIALAEDLGWVQGYEGYFRPLDNMTRAEVMTTVNRVLERSTRKENMLKDMIEWPDNDPTEWYYEAVQEATNSHEYYRTNEKVYKLNFYYEAWTKLIENPDWAALERTWSDANSQR